jgi:hypothetical protein
VDWGEAGDLLRQRRTGRQRCTVAALIVSGQAGRSCRVVAESPEGFPGGQGIKRWLRVRLAS